MKMKVEDIINFIKLYQMYPCLWNPRDDNFRNRKIKLEALNEMAIIAGVTPLEVEKKIAICLSQNRRARRKAIELRRTGMIEREIEKCVWYGYKHLNFLNEVHAELKGGLKNELEDTFMNEYEGEDEDKTHQSAEDDSNLEDPLSTELFTAEMSIPSTSKNPPSSNNTQNNPSTSHAHHVSSHGGSSHTQNHTQRNPTTRKRNKPLNDLDDLIYETCKLIKNQSEQNDGNDETKLFCEYIAKKMKKLDIITRRDVEHKINCILYDAEMKILQSNFQQAQTSNNEDVIEKFDF